VLRHRGPVRKRWNCNINSSGQLIINSGLFNDTGNTVLNSGGQLLFQGGNLREFGTLSGSGTFTNSSGGVLVYDSGAVVLSNVTNLANGVLQGGVWESLGGGTINLNNNQAITDIASSTAVQFDGVGTFNNIGQTLTNLEGELEISGPGSTVTFSRSITSTGGISVYQGAVQFTGPFLNSGSVYISGGTATFNQAFANTNGTVSVSGGSLTASNATDLRNGVLGGGQWSVTSGGAVTLNGSAAIYALGAQADILLDGSGSLNNITQTLTSNAGTIQINRGSPVTFGQSLTNTGQLFVSGGTVSFSQAFTNTSGLVYADGGSVTASNATDLHNGVLNGGQWIVASNGSSVGSISLNGGASINAIGVGASINWDGTGSINNIAQTLTSNAGTLALGNSNPLTFTQAFTNSGTFYVGGAGPVRFTEAFMNSGNGSVAITSGLLNASSFTQSAGSTSLNGGTLNATGIAVNGGAFGGSGTVIGNVNISDATLQVGPGAGQLHVEGSLAQTGGTVTFEIDPNGSGGFLESTLILDPGNTTTFRNANIVFDFLNDADPLAFYNSGAFNSNTFLNESDGSTLSAGALYAMLTGDTFGVESSNYNVTSFAFDPANGATDLTETPVPLPAAAWLLVSGLAGLGGFARMRRPA
jgi:hypothetical protein